MRRFSLFVILIENRRHKWAGLFSQIERTKPELYNLTSDLTDTNDLTDKHPETYSGMKRRMRRVAPRGYPLKS